MELGRCLRVIGSLVWVKSLCFVFVTCSDVFFGGCDRELEDSVIICGEVLYGRHYLGLFGRVANKIKRDNQLIVVGSRKRKRRDARSMFVVYVG